jgi:hypothetical protein
MRTAALGLPVILALLGSCSSKDGGLQKALDKGTGVVTLPPGAIELDVALRVPPHAHDLEIVGSQKSVLRAGPKFQGRALIVIQNANGVRLSNFGIDGNREVLDRPTEIPAGSTPYSMHFQRGGILVEDSDNVTITGIEIREVVGFAVLASRARKFKVDKVTVAESGSNNIQGFNNTSGGILIEESSEDFEVRDCNLRRVRGNGIWTRASGFSTRNQRGIIAGNHLEVVGRRAIEVGHANRVRVEQNTIRFAGFPPEVVDPDPNYLPAAMAASQRVDESAFVSNLASDINGPCFDLDGFHDGQVLKNTCRNRGELQEYPHGSYALALGNSYADMDSQLVTIDGNNFDGFRLGAVFLIGHNHKVTGNTFRNLNQAHCNRGLNNISCEIRRGEPQWTTAGIYLGFRAGRPSPARENLIRGNQIHGFQMKANCIQSAPGVAQSDNTVSGNTCLDAE